MQQLIQIGKVTGREIGKNKDGTEDVLLLQVEVTSPEDIQTAELIKLSGDDTNPPDNSLVVLVSVGPAWKIAIAVNDRITPVVPAGEKKLYSSDGGVIKAFIHWLKTGAMIISGTLIQILGSTKIELTAPTIEVNGSADFAVQFTALKTGFDQFKSDFNAHLHTGVLSGPASTGGTTITSAATIDPAKVATVKLP